MQIVINAGGNGTRLWPISNQSLPKQFCKLIGEKTLLRETFDRLLEDFEVSTIWVNTNSKFIKIVQQILPELASDHILSEPQKRDTLPAVCAHAAVVAGKTSGEEPIIFITSDSYIAPKQAVKKQNQAFKKTLESLEKNEYDIIVGGIKPTYASSRYGYIQIDSKNAETCFSKTTNVLSFKEKPNQETATEYFESKNYLWNFGSFGFKFNNLKKILQKILPETILPLDEIFKNKKIDVVNFEKLPKTSFDYGVLEKCKKLGVIGMELDIWDDIGSYDSLYNYSKEVSNLESLEKKDLKVNQIQVKGNNNKFQICSDKKVVFVGVSDLMLIETENTILIINPKNANEVKNVANYFEKE
jgi:mannose-1-phosphate guanylyltransferase